MKNDLTLIILIGVLIGFVGTTIFLNIIDSTGFNTETGFELILGLPFNVHHSLVGIIIMSVSGIAFFLLNENKYVFLFFFIGLGMFIQHAFLDEGLIFISSL